MNGAEMRSRMAAGEVFGGLGLRLARSPEIAKIAKSLGFDWLFVDLEHNPLGIDLACQICVAALDAGLPPLVRVPGHEPTMAARLLDGGAAGIIVPHIEEPAEIEAFVERCRFAPQGHRSLGGLLPQLDYAALPAAEAMRLANERTLLCAMIESPKAVENAEAIAAVPGVDMLLFGTNDLAIEMGIPGQLDDARIEAAYRQVIAGATAQGKVVGLGGVYTKPLLERYLPLGFRFALLGSDLALLAKAAREQIAMARGFIEKR
jgi:4-hydroxy-2-oxoheptanedioate aldolase